MAARVSGQTAKAAQSIIRERLLGVGRIRTQIVAFGAGLFVGLCGLTPLAAWADDGQPTAGLHDVANSESGEVESVAESPRVRRRELEDPPPRGFHPRLQKSEVTPEQAEMIRQLEAIGYVAGSVAGPAEDLVTVFEEDRAQPGLNFYTSTHAPEAVLMDGRGNVLHRWRFRRKGVDRHLFTRLGKDFWRRGYLFANGDILAVVGGRSLLKLDKDSKLLWAHLDAIHHDLEVMPDGQIYALSRRARVVEHFNPDTPILQDFIVVLGEDGVEKRRLSLLECFERSEFADTLEEVRREAGDIFHTNSIDVLDGSAVHLDPAFKEGNVLVSIRTLSALAVIDMDLRRVVWLHRGRFKRQHDAQMLPSGRLLLFDNLGLGDSSSVIEFDPSTGEIVWEYRGSPERPFFSRFRGMVERQPNGNTLISESDNGRAFEVDADGQIVWEFYNPHRAGDQDEFIAAINDMTRIPVEHTASWLKLPKP